MIKERLKFYADTPRGDKNKYFCFSTDILSLEETIKRFLRAGFVFRAAWYDKIDTDTGEVLMNSRISDSDIQRVFNELVTESKKSNGKKQKSVKVQKNDFNTSPVLNDPGQRHITAYPNNDSNQANDNPIQ